jgi:excisionase family DNA binding protein
MAVHTVTEAAKLAGVTRRTIYRYIKQGKLSTVVTGSDSAQIETSELLRVFGNLSHPEESKVSTGSHQKEPEYVTRLMAEMSQIRIWSKGSSSYCLRISLRLKSCENR